MTLTTVTVTKASEFEYVVANADTAEPVEFVRIDPDDDLWHTYDTHDQLINHWATSDPDDIIGSSVYRLLGLTETRQIIANRRIETIKDRRATILKITQALERIEATGRLSQDEEHDSFAFMTTLFHEAFGKARNYAEKINKWPELR